MQGDQFTAQEFDYVESVILQLTWDYEVEVLKGFADYFAELPEVRDGLSKVYGGVKMGNDIISLAKDMIELINIVIEYHTTTDDEKKKQILLGAAKTMFSITGDIMSFSDVTSEFSFLFSCASTVLEYGLNMVNTRIAQLEYYDMLAWDCLNDGVVDANPLNNNRNDISGTRNECSQLRAFIGLARAASKAMEGAGESNKSINSMIKQADEALTTVEDIANSIISKVNELTGESYINLDAIARDNLKEIEEEEEDAEKKSVNRWASSSIFSFDPLILDLDKDGFNVEKKQTGAYFDLNCDGFAEKINWTRTDAILALDKNENGLIDDGSEVFGDYHLLQDGSRAKNGFEALAQYDTNGDEVIDETDAIFNQLKLWMDADGDGITTEGELKSLQDMHIKAIHLNYENVNEVVNGEAIIGNVATFEYEDGEEALMIPVKNNLIPMNGAPYCATKYWNDALHRPNILWYNVSQNRSFIEMGILHRNHLLARGGFLQIYMIL